MGIENIVNEYEKRNGSLLTQEEIDELNAKCINESLKIGCSLLEFYNAIMSFVREDFTIEDSINLSRQVILSYELGK